MSESNIPDNPFFEVTDEAIPFGERVSIAVSQFVATIALVITGVLLLPVNFLRTLFKTKRRVVGIKKLPSPRDVSSPPPSNDGEDWKRAHNEEYGDD